MNLGKMFDHFASNVNQSKSLCPLKGVGLGKDLGYPGPVNQDVTCFVDILVQCP